MLYHADTIEELSYEALSFKSLAVALAGSMTLSCVLCIVVYCSVGTVRTV